MKDQEIGPYNQIFNLKAKKKNQISNCAYAQ